MRYNLQNTIASYERGDKLKFLFFWGHTKSKAGETTKACLSQWYESKFVVADITYLTAEHWMMAKKAELFEDETILQKIIDSKTPGEAKKLGRQIVNFDPAIWDKHKFEIVASGNAYKFEQNPKLKEFLINTKDRIIVEASPVDKFWGIGMAKDNPKVNNPTLWKGENLLGYALMEARDRIKR